MLLELILKLFFNGRLKKCSSITVREWRRLSLSLVHKGFPKTNEISETTVGNLYCLFLQRYYIYIDELAGRTSWLNSYFYFYEQFKQETSKANCFISFSSLPLLPSVGNKHLRIMNIYITRIAFRVLKILFENDPFVFGIKRSFFLNDPFVLNL